MFRSARPLRRFLSTSLGTNTLGPRRPEGPVLTPIFLSNPPTPKEIVKHFDKHVIGQERAKQVVSVAIYNHYCRLFRHMLNPDDGAVLEKSNILLAGPSGTGKTLLAKTAASVLNVPFAMADSTAFTEAGYVGEDVDMMLYRLLESSGFNLSIAQKGIVFLDEVDKLAKTTTSSAHGGKDVGGQGVQQALLKMIEGATVDVKDRRKGGERVTIPFDTQSLLFIFSGAFNGLEEIVQERLSKKPMGFASAKSVGDAPVGSWKGQLMSTDLTTFGLIPEFVGRIPVIARLERLDQQALERILTEPVGSLISQYKTLFAMNNVSLEFTQEAVSALAAIALDLGVGARGLRSILEGLLQDWMYEVPKSSIIRIRIDEACVEGSRKPLIEYRASEKGKRA